MVFQDENGKIYGYPFCYEIDYSIFFFLRKQQLTRSQLCQLLGFKWNPQSKNYEKRTTVFESIQRLLAYKFIIEVNIDSSIRGRPLVYYKIHPQLKAHKDIEYTYLKCYLPPKKVKLSPIYEDEEQNKKIKC